MGECGEGSQAVFARGQRPAPRREAVGWWRGADATVLVERVGRLWNGVR